MELHIEDNAIWKKRTRVPQIRRFVIAKNNEKTGIITSNHDGILRTYFWNPITGQLDDKPCLEEDYYGVLTPDGRYVHYFKDTKGNQQGHRWRMNVETGEHEDLTPDFPNYFGYTTTFSNDSKKFAFIASSPGFSNIYLLDFDDAGKLLDRKILLETKESIMMPRFSPDGKLLAFASTENGDRDTSAVLLFDADTGKVAKKYCAGKGSYSYPRMFVPNTDKMIVAIEKDSDMKYYLWNYKTDELVMLDIEGEGFVDVSDITKDGKRVLVNRESKAWQHFSVLNLDDKSQLELDKIEGMAHPFQISNNEIFILNTCSSYKSRILAFDIETGKLKRTALELPGSIEAKKEEEVCFVGALGDKVFGWLKKPEGKGPFPTIIEVPGGPFNYAYNTYESDVYLEHGFARLYFSYHGCGSFGLDFQKSIIGRIGELELEDMVAARNWLVEQGIAIPDQIFLMGGSYGGYLTLWGMVRRPDLWRAGLARTPIADWAADWEDTNGELRKMQTMMFGCTPSENPELWAKSSPITYVENMKAPLQIIAGINDTRCPKRQTEEFIAKAKELGKDVEEYWFDEGHGSNVVDEQIHQIELRLKFLKKVLEE